MTNKLSKRKMAGAPHREQKQVDPPLNLPPHRKERTYVLVVTETTTSSYISTSRYPSKAARQQARAAYEKKVRRESGWDRYGMSYRQRIETIYTECEE